MKTVRTFVLFILLLVLLQPSMLLADVTLKEINNLPFMGKHFYFGMYMAGQKMGWHHISMEKKKGNYIVTEQSEISQNVGGSLIQMKTTVINTYDKNGHISIIDYNSESPVGENRLRAIVTGKTMSINSFTGGRMNSETIATPDINLKDKMALSVAIVKNKTEIGKEYKSLIYDPSIKKVVRITEKIESVETRLLNGIESKVYIVKGGMPDLGIEMSASYNTQGVALDTTISGAVELRLESREEAMDNSSNGNLLLSTIVKLDKKLPNAHPDKLQLGVGGIKENLIVNNERQSWKKLDNGQYLLTVKKESVNPEQAVFITQSQKTEFDEYLKEESSIQISDPRIKKRAGQLKKGVRNSYELAEKIMQWVYDNMSKDYTPTWSNASEAIETMRGDCGEHAVLFVALARAAGLPAREVVGMMYLDDIQGFGFHAWAEVWIGKWVSIDPSWNQFPVYADHIVLAVGGASQQLKTVSAFGNISLKQVDNH